MKKNLTTAGSIKTFAYKHLLLVMKITVFLIVFSVASVMANSGHSQQTKLSIQLTNASLGKILNHIEDNSQYYFMYNNELIDLSRKMDIDVQNKSIDEILTLLFEKSGINYKIYDRQIVLSPSSQKNTDFSLQRQTLKVSGKVTDSSGSPLPGVTVIVKGTIEGAITDINGNYSLSNVPADATVIFSFVGMGTQEIAVAGNQQIDVKLSEETVGLEEVVAIGYGVVKKRDLTGAVAKVKAKELSAASVSRVDQALQGKSAGVQVTSTNGSPGAGTTIRIRGGNSISASNEPLFAGHGNVALLLPH